MAEENPKNQPESSLSPVAKSWVEESRKKFNLSGEEYDQLQKDTIENERKSAGEKEKRQQEEKQKSELALKEHYEKTEFKGLGKGFGPKEESARDANGQQIMPRGTMPTAKGGERDKTSKTGAEKGSAQEKKESRIFSPEGVVMLTIGFTLDFFFIICFILILAFGVGLLLSKIIYFLGLFILVGWAAMRDGAGSAKDKIFSLLKRRKWNLIGKFIPGADAFPLLTLAIWRELKGAAA